MDREAMSERDALERAQRIHAEHIVIDTLAPSFVGEWVMTPAMVELALKLQAEGKKRSAIRAALAEYLLEACETDPETREAHLAYWNRAGVTAVSDTLWGAGPPDGAWEATLASLGRASRMIRALGGAVVTAGSAAEVEQAKREGRRAVIYNIQNGEPFGDRLDRVDTLYGLGLRVVQLTYNLRNRFADGCVERRDGGISRFGAALVEKLNDRRILVDVSHCSDNTVMDALELSTAPVILSHTAARALSGHPRGKTDEAIRAVADKGGYIGVLILPAFLMPEGGDGRAAKLGHPASWSTLDTVVDHVVHIMNVAGSDAVGIGTDWAKPYYNVLDWSSNMVREEASSFDWVGWRPQDRFDPNAQTAGLETWDKWPDLTAAMLRRGIPEETVAKIVGANFLRVFREVCG